MLLRSYSNLHRSTAHHNIHPEPGQQLSNHHPFLYSSRDLTTPANFVSRLTFTRSTALHRRSEDTPSRLLFPFRIILPSPILPSPSQVRSPPASSTPSYSVTAKRARYPASSRGQPRPATEETPPAPRQALHHPDRRHAQGACRPRPPSGVFFSLDARRRMPPSSFQSLVQVRGFRVA
jgi:hypothetical protein